MTDLRFVHVVVRDGRLVCVPCGDAHVPTRDALDRFDSRPTVAWVRKHARCVRTS